MIECLIHSYILSVLSVSEYTIVTIKHQAHLTVDSQVTRHCKIQVMLFADNSGIEFMISP